jgi:hypothetical protein
MIQLHAQKENYTTTAKEKDEEEQLIIKVSALWWEMYL